MKKIKNIGKVLEKEQQKAIKGGGGSCHSTYYGDPFTGTSYTMPYNYGFPGNCGCFPGAAIYAPYNPGNGNYRCG